MSNQIDPFEDIIETSPNQRCEAPDGEPQAFHNTDISPENPQAADAELFDPEVANDEESPDQEEIPGETADEAVNPLDDIFGDAKQEEEPENEEDEMADFLGGETEEPAEEQNVFEQESLEDKEISAEDQENPQKVAEIENKNDLNFGRVEAEQKEEAQMLKDESAKYLKEESEKEKAGTDTRIKEEKEEYEANEKFIKGDGKKWLKVKKLMGELPKGRVGDVLKAKFEDEEEQSDK